MKHKIAFVTLLTLIIAVGISGVNIAGYFFSDSSLEEAVIDRDSVKSNAIYISSPDEISFNPMGIIEINDASSTEDLGSWTYDNVVNAKLVCGTIIESLSGYSEQAEFASPLTNDINNALRLSQNNYFYLDGYKYLNPQGELRYVDCIISPVDYRIIYINFYSSKEYSPNSDDISKGLKNFQKNSEEFYLSINNLYDNKTAALLDSFELRNNTVETLPEAYKEAFGYFDSISDGIQNPVEHFWLRSLVLSRVCFYDTSLSSGLDYDENPYLYETPAYGTGYVYELFDTAVYNLGESLFTDSIEYIAYDGRIYQTIDFHDIYYYTNTLVVIYNIEEEIVEGFYAPPSPWLS